jgi:hypothetical protein
MNRREMMIMMAAAAACKAATGHPGGLGVQMMTDEPKISFIIIRPHKPLSYDQQEIMREQWNSLRKDNPELPLAIVLPAGVEIDTVRVDPKTGRVFMAKDFQY